MRYARATRYSLLSALVLLLLLGCRLILNPPPAVFEILQWAALLLCVAFVVAGEASARHPRTTPGQPGRREEAQREALNEIEATIPIILYSFRLRPDGSSCFPYASRAMEDMFGIKPEVAETDAAPVFAIMHPDELVRLHASIRESARTLEPWHLEFRGRGLIKKGEVWYEGLSFPRREQDGGTIWYGYIAEVTTRMMAQRALKESEERFVKLFRSSPVPLAVSDMDTGNFIDVNEEVERLFGWTRQELIGRSSLELGIWREVSQREAAMAQLRAAGSVRNTYVQLVKKTGQVLDVIWSIEKLTFAGRDVMLSSILDVTDTRRAERALKESEERFATIFRSSPVPLAVSEIDTGVFIDVNEESEKIWGYTREQMVGRSSHELKIWARDSDRERVVAALQETGAVRNAPVQMSSHASGARECLWSLQKISLGGRQVILSSLLDITEAKRAETALKESEERFATIFNLSPVPIVLSELDSGRVVDANRGFIEMFGYSREELAEASATKLMVRDDEEARARFMSAVRERGSLREQGARLRTKAGAVKDVLWSAQILSLGGRQLLLSVVYDITERTQLEEKLLHAQKMEAVGRLAGGIAHDYNNMIGVIIGFASLLEEKLDPGSPFMEDVRQILAAAQRSANLTKQLLAFARKQVAAPVPLDLNQSLRSIEKVITRILGEDITLRMYTQEGLWTVKVDPSQVDQVLANLATNARDAIENVGAITIETSNMVVNPDYAGAHVEAAPGEYVVLSFSDTGRGMDAATRARLFEPYFTTKPKDRGTGLGLATIFGIMRQNNGFISVYSEVGHGTTFKLFFPRHEGQVERREEHPAETVKRGTETILVVEDEEQLLGLSKSTLEKNGYTVVAFTSPKRAIAYCEKSGQQMDLLLSDMVMPEMNGKDLSERLCALRPDLKTLYMSGYPANVIAERGFLEEGTHFIQKPFRPVELLGMVRKVLDG